MFKDNEEDYEQTKEHHVKKLGFQITNQENQGSDLKKEENYKENLELEHKKKISEELFKGSQELDEKTRKNICR